VLPSLQSLAHVTVVLVFLVFSQIKRLHSEQTVLTFQSLLLGQYEHLPLLRLCCCPDVDGVLWATVLRATYTPAASIALTTGSWRPFGLLALYRMLGFVSSLPNSNRNRYLRFGLLWFQSLFFNQIVKAFRAPISSMFMKSLRGYLEVRLAQEYSLFVTFIG